MSSVARFWAKVHIGRPDECWPWLGFKKPSGHGLTTLDGRVVHASRKAWVLAGGTIPDGWCINHTCHNAACCNPTHMYVGTRAHNMGDRFGTDGVTRVAQRRARKIKSQVVDPLPNIHSTH